VCAWRKVTAAFECCYVGAPTIAQNVDVSTIAQNVGGSTIALLTQNSFDIKKILL
jgi:hypothetical protein